MSKMKDLKVAVLMMQKNESELLNKWTAYHSYLFGIENLFIFDNGSNSNTVLSSLACIETRGGNVIREYESKADFENKGRIFQEKIEELQLTGDYDFFVPLDCDEFLACLDDYGEVSCDRTAVNSELTKHLDCEDVLMINGQLYNSPMSNEWFNRQPYRKCFFYKNTIKELDLGFHWGKTRNSDKEIRTGLVQFHFHNKPFTVAKEHAREKLKDRVENFQQETLQKYNGPGLHLTHFFTQTEEEFYSKQRRLKHFNTRALVHKFSELDIEWPFKEEISLVCESLNLGDDEILFSRQTEPFVGSADNIVVRDDVVEIEGWGIFNLMQPVTRIILDVNGASHELSISSRFEREDVCKRLNLSPLPIGFKATIPLKTIAENLFVENEISIRTSLDNKMRTYFFDINRKYRNVFNNTITESNGE